MRDKATLKQYKTVQISTVDRGRLLLMLYDGCAKFLTLAKAGLENKDVVKFARFLSKGQAIIAELTNTLDFEKGGQIARDLDRLYDFMLFYLTEANIQKDPLKIQRVIDLLQTVSGAYREIIEGSPKNIAANETLQPKLPQPPTVQASEPKAEAPKVGQSLRISL